MSIHISFGSKFSGKTTNVITDYSKNSSLNKIIISFDKITRKDNDKHINITRLESHSGLIAPNCYKTNLLKNHLDENNYHIFSKDVLEYYITMFHEAQHIYIDDAHLFDDLKEFILHMKSYGKNIYVYGLESSKHNEEMTKIIPYASSIRKFRDVQ